MALLRAKFALILLLWAGVGASAPDAHATQYAFGNEATVSWAPASGNVLLYAVYVSRNGGSFPSQPERYTADNRATLLGVEGERIVIQVAAVGVGGEGPRSPSSDSIVFVASNGAAIGGDPRFSTDLRLGGDGGSDLLWFSAAENRLTLWRQRSEGGIDAKSESGWAAAGFTLAGSGDFDGNGALDLLWRNDAGSNLIQLRSSWSDTWTLGFTDLMEPRYEVAAVADLDGNGRSEIVWRDSITGLHTVWRVNRFTVDAQNAIGGYPDSWRIVAAYDENGDGRDDLLWRETATGLNRLWTMQDVDDWSETWRAHEPPRFRVASSGDLDGDGDGELVWEDIQAEQRVIWSGGSGKRLDLNEELGAGWLAAGAADLDGDGDRELLLQHRTSALVVAASVRNGSVIEAGFVGFAPTLLSTLQGR